MPLSLDHGIPRSLLVCLTAWTGCVQSRWLLQTTAGISGIFVLTCNHVALTDLNISQIYVVLVGGNVIQRACLKVVMYISGKYPSQTAR